MRCCFVALLLLALAGCESAQKMTAPPLEVATPITLNPRQVSSVRAGVARMLKNHDLEEIRFGRMIAGKTSKGVIVCGYANGKNSEGEYTGERPFHGVFLGLDNASGFIVTGTGGTDDDNAATLEICRRSGLELKAS
jgi:hypothetical protein